MRKKNVVNVADEVLAKADIIIEKVQVVLDMFPNKYHIRLVVVPDSSDVARIYKKKYGKRVNHIAYYSLSEKRSIFQQMMRACGSLPMRLGTR